MVATRHYSAVIDNNGRVFVAGKPPMDERFSCEEIQGHNPPLAKNRDQYSFTAVEYYKDRIVSLATSDSCMVAVDEKGNLWVVDSNDKWRLGLYDCHPSINIPTLYKVPGLAETVQFKSVCTGKKFSAALDTNGNVWCFGSNVEGQLGLHYETLTDGLMYTMVPVLNNRLKNIKQIDACDTLLVALDNDGVVWTSGKILNCGTSDFLPTPLNKNNKMKLICSSIIQHTKTDIVIVKVACGKSHVLLLDHKGMVLSFGYNDAKELGYSSVHYFYRDNKESVRQVVFDPSEHTRYDNINDDDSSKEHDIYSSNSEEYCEFHVDGNSDEPCTCVDSCGCDSHSEYGTSQDCCGSNDITDIHHGSINEGDGPISDKSHEPQKKYHCECEMTCSCNEYDNSTSRTIIKDIYSSDTYSIAIDSFSCMWVLGFMKMCFEITDRPRKVLEASNKQVLFVGVEHLLLKDDDGMVYAIGNNVDGALGLSNSIGHVFLYPLPDFHLGFPSTRSVKSSKSRVTIDENLPNINRNHKEILLRGSLDKRSIKYPNICQVKSDSKRFKQMCYPDFSPTFTIIRECGLFKEHY